MKKILFALATVTGFIVIETPAASAALHAIQQIPEPGSMFLFGIGLFILGKLAAQPKGD